MHKKKAPNFGAFFLCELWLSEPEEVFYAVGENECPRYNHKLNDKFCAYKRREAVTDKLYDIGLF